MCGFVDSITLLAPHWESAVHFGGPDARARLALSFGAVRSNTVLKSACNLHADAGFDDNITFLAPQRGSAINFGGSRQNRSRSELSVQTRD